MKSFLYFTKKLKSKKKHGAGTNFLYFLKLLLLPISLHFFVVILQFFAGPCGSGSTALTNRLCCEFGLETYA